MGWRAGGQRPWHVPIDDAETTSARVRAHTNTRVRTYADPTPSVAVVVAIPITRFCRGVVVWASRLVVSIAMAWMSSRAPLAVRNGRAAGLSCQCYPLSCCLLPTRPSDALVPLSNAPALLPLRMVAQLAPTHVLTNRPRPLLVHATMTLLDGELEPHGRLPAPADTAAAAGTGAERGWWCDLLPDTRAGDGRCACAGAFVAKVVKLWGGGGRLLK